jgi:monoamine oxidase
MDCEVLIIGAGAAGLACADRLQQAGVSFKILEARNRVGGRAWSLLLKDPAVIEYGAEFIHGADRETLDIYQRTQTPFVDVCDRRLFKSGKSLVDLPDFWEDLDRVHALLTQDITHDRSLNDFIEAHKKVISPTLKKIYASYIEGFEAADLNLAGERGMAAIQNAEEPELNKQSQFRPLAGYATLMERYFKDIQIRKTQIAFNTVVKNISHERNSVSVEAIRSRTKRRHQYQARKLVLTVPIGVLKTSIQFSPAIPEMETALANLHMGHIQRMTFQFKDRFWEKLSDHPVGFLHAGPERYFPTWWTQMPLRSPYLVAWQGGPKAYEMSTWSEKKRVNTALTTLAFLTGRKKEFLIDHCVRSFSHNWSKDPYALGAYSYIGVQADRSLAKLKKAFAGNIYLAGEGIADNSGRGTVHGAFKSGREAAEKILSR